MRPLLRGTFTPIHAVSRDKCTPQGCVGGGSNFGGTAFPFVGENIKKGKKTRCIAVEPVVCPSMTKGVCAFDYGDTAKLILRVARLGGLINEYHEEQCESE